MNPKFNIFILIENICLILIVLVLVIVPAVTKSANVYTKQTNKELQAENERLKTELEVIQKEFISKSDISIKEIVSKIPDVSGDCSLPKDIEVIQDIKKEYPELVDVVYKEAITHNINKDYLIAVILTETGFQKGENGFLGLFDVHNVVLLLEDVMTQEIHNFLRQSGIKTDEELLTEDTSDSVFHKSFSYEKSYVKVFGRDKLNKLYNNYKLVSGKPFSSLK